MQRTGATLEARDLHKRFGQLHAVQGVSFEVHPGECVGLLGPNGAGKSTTIAMICGLLQPDSGEVLISGRRLEGDGDPEKAQLGFVPQDLSLYDELSARKNLEFFGELYGLRGPGLSEAVERELGAVSLADRQNDRVGGFSGGMKRRLNLAAALLHNPQLILLDEPTVGVDPQSRNALFDSVRRLRDNGKAVLYTTHYMEEVEKLCDRVVIVDHGRVVANDSVEAVRQRSPITNVITIELCDIPTPECILQVGQSEGIQNCDVSGKTLTIQLLDLGPHLPTVLAELDRHGARIRHISTERQSLESAFLEMTGKKIRDS